MRGQGNWHAQIRVLSCQHSTNPTAAVQGATSIEDCPTYSANTLRPLKSHQENISSMRSKTCSNPAPQESSGTFPRKWQNICVPCVSWNGLRKASPIPEVDDAMGCAGSTAPAQLSRHGHSTELEDFHPDPLEQNEPWCRSWLWVVIRVYNLHTKPSKFYHSNK